MKLNQRDLEILRILLTSDEPLTSTQIVRIGESTGLTQSTSQVVTRKLVAAELIEVRGITHSGNVLCRQFGATEKAKEVINQRFIESYRNYSNILSPRDAVEAMLKAEDDTEKRAQQIEELETLLKELQAKKN